MSEETTMTQEQLTETIIETYIKADTDYAIMLFGEWGIGKTYYLRNELIPEIESKKYRKPFYISLYGVQSADCVQRSLESQAVTRIISSGKIDSLPALEGLGKLLSNGLGKASAHKCVPTNLELIFSAIPKGILLKNGIVIFDDLERINANDELAHSILGYINTLVEHYCMKVIICGHKEKCVEPLKGRSSIEKVIRHRFSFVPAHKDGVRNMLKLSGMPCFTQDIDQHVDATIAMSEEVNNHSIREIKTAINNFRILDKVAESIPEFGGHTTNQLSLYYSVLSISFKLLRSERDKSQSKENNKDLLTTLASSNLSKLNEIPPVYVLFDSPSISKFIEKGIFNKVGIIDSITTIIQMNSKTQNAYSMLIYWSEHDDNEVISAFQTMYQVLSNGEQPISDIYVKCIVAMVSLQEIGVIEIGLDKLLDQVLEGARKALTISSYDISPDYHFYIQKEGKETNPKLEAFCNILQELNSEIPRICKTEALNELHNNWEAVDEITHKTIDEYRDVIFPRYSKGYYQLLSNSMIMGDVVRKAKPMTILRFTRTLIGYLGHSLRQSYIDKATLTLELDDFKDLRKLITERKENTSDKIATHLLDEALREINEFLQKLKRTFRSPHA